MQRRTEIIIAVVIIIALVVLLVLWFNRVQAPTASTKTDKAAITTSTKTSSTTGTTTPVVATSAAASTVARVFVERFGSYSTESGYTNIDDVLSLTTTELQGKLKSLLEDAQAKPSGKYYGVSTRLMSSKVVSETDTQTVFKISTQRQESFDSPANTSVRYQDINVTLVKQGDLWLVSDFSWL